MIVPVTETQNWQVGIVVSHVCVPVCRQHASKMLCKPAKLNMYDYMVEPVAVNYY